MLNSLFSSRITFSLAYHTALRCYVSRTGTASSCRTTAWCAWTLKDAAPPCSSTAVASSSYHLRGTCSLLPNRATMPMKREFWGWRKFSRFDGKMKSIWVSWCFGRGGNNTRHTRHGEWNFRLASVNLKSLASLASVKFTVQTLFSKNCWLNPKIFNNLINFVAYLCLEITSSTCEPNKGDHILVVTGFHFAYFHLLASVNIRWRVWKLTHSPVWRV